MARVDVYFITGLVLFALGILLDVILSETRIISGLPAEGSVPTYYYLIPIISIVLGVITLQKDVK